MAARIPAREYKRIGLKNIHFIINTLSPNAKKVQDEIASFFGGHANRPIVKLSKYKSHTIELALASISEGADIIVACGGDGTVNEVAQCLVNTPVKMGVLPIGSGNGLARHLRIPTKLPAALELLDRCECKSMDVGKANDRYFLCNVSVAFSAQVIHCYDQIPQRGFRAYTRAFLKAISAFKYASFELEERNGKVKSTPFVLLLSNTDQLGYNRTLTPDASLFDGKLDMVRIEKSNPLALSIFMFFAFFKKFPPFAKVRREQLDGLKLQSANKELKIQLDGEKLELDTDTLDIKVLPKALEVIC
jgi:diacylglycerol kinase family enzyme